MIKARTQKTRYTIYDTESDLSITLDVTDDVISILNGRQEKEFVFIDNNDSETKKRWRTIIKLFSSALDMIERDKKQVKEFV